ncbi:MAG TPA: M14 family metallopeptidase [Thermoanaerobaculia bacterium]|nr:M14 family metallopeptidase [Thermoanaerobaculia bacterium]
MQRRVELLALVLAVLVSAAAKAAASAPAEFAASAASAASAGVAAGARRPHGRPADKPNPQPRREPGGAPAPEGLLAPLSSGDVVDLPPLDERVPRPDAVLGYPVGSRFTHWDRIAAYLDALAAASPRVKVWEYGHTYEGRPLKLAAVSSAENLARLDEIRAEHLRLADPAALSEGERERLGKRLPAVVWLAYGVHGDEASSSEAAMVTAYALAAAQGEMAELLDGMIVLIDPLCNPDGRERYLHGYEQRQGEAPNVHRLAAEHFQPWPGGRQNHYLIDLNRDWAWATQQESRSRVAAYRAWEPQVYVDFHEMSTESSYFFPPAAEPVHPRIDRRVISWLDTFGRANAEAFDRHGWIYYKEENYDLFYPGYGDSYPSLHGAIGMTYEMAGGGRGGLAIDRADGTLLTLADRVGRHLTSSLATVRTAGRNARQLLADYVTTRLRASEGPGRVHLWPADQPEARALADLLLLHGVRVQQLAKAAEINAQPLLGGREENAHRFPAGTFAVSTAQPLGALVAALLDRDAPMAQSFLERQRRRFEQNREGEFYDITAWSLPLAFNLRMWTASANDLPAGRQAMTPASAASAAGAATVASTATVATAAGAAGGGPGSGELGWLVPPQGIASYRLAAALGKRHVHYRIALRQLANDGATYPAGTLYVPRHGNPDGLGVQLASLLREGGLAAHAVASSYAVSGVSLGSNNMPAVRQPRIGLISGEGVDPTSFGFLWFLLDREIGLPYDRLDLERLQPAAMAEFDVLILPSGAYEERIGDRSRGALDAWIKAGGELVAIGGETARWLHEHDMASWKPWKAPEADEESEGSQDKALAERDIATPGAIVATRLSPQHPLAIGLPSSPPVLVEGSAVFLPSGDPRRDVLVAASQDPVIAGFAWPEAKQRLAGSLLVGAEAHGSGSVVLFVQEPDFRLFWRGTMPLLLNAIAYGPGLGLGGRN